MTTEQRAIKFLAGTGKGVIPKKQLYESAAQHHKLKQAVQAGFTSVREHELYRKSQTESFYREVLKCTT